MSMQLKQTTNDFLKLNNFNELTSVQTETLKYINSKKDVVVISKTGTGKTHAYLLPIAEIINDKSNKTQVIVFLPTRELAYQVYQKAIILKKVFPDLRVSLASGGTENKKNNTSNTNVPHIVIGTPGRINELYLKKEINIDNLQLLIIDEADMSLEYGFLDEFNFILSKLIKKVKIMCFSATLPKELENFINKFLLQPKFVYVNDKKRNPKITHYLIDCKHRTYFEELLLLIPCIHPYICLIFTNSKKEADEAYKVLIDHNIKAAILHGGLESRERKRTLKLLYEKKITYLVCSDLASRGIDNDAISHVISLGFPKEREYYIHRSGRTGRNKQTGISYALYCDKDQDTISKLKKDGVVFNDAVIKNNNIINVKKRSNRSKRNDELEKEIAKTLYKKNEKVKPGYKKKRKMKIQKLKQKVKRQFIKEQIKKQRKERYKQEARSKYYE